MNINEIIITRKILRTEGNVKNLIESIQKAGIIQPLIINDKNELLAGGRRYAALKKLGYTDVPVHAELYI